MSHADTQLNTPEFNDARRCLAIFCQPDKLAALRAQMTAQGPSEAAWQSASRLLGINWDDAPAHVNVQVKGELGFLVERRVWQSAVFATFVRNNINPSFRRGAVVEWCRAALGARSDFAILQENKHLLPREENKALPWAPRAIRAYLRALVKQGFLASCGGGRYEILRR
jgi:hypothetical protein